MTAAPFQLGAVVKTAASVRPRRYADRVGSVAVVRRVTPLRRTVRNGERTILAKTKGGEVERTIAELGGIFSQLSAMVAEQGELAVRIDEHMDETVSNVESAQAHLLQYLSRITGNRWLAMKVFGLLLLFMVFFVVFIA